MGRRELLDKLREETINDIIQLMKKYEVEELHVYDFSPGESPIVHEDQNDSNMSYTLDHITLLNGNGGAEFLKFSASSCWDSAEWYSDTIDTDTLIGISEWLFEYEDDIREMCKE